MDKVLVYEACPLLIFLSTEWNLCFICQPYGKEHVVTSFGFRTARVSVGYQLQSSSKTGMDKVPGLWSMLTTNIFVYQMKSPYYMSALQQRTFCWHFLALGQQEYHQVRQNVITRMLPAHMSTSKTGMDKILGYEAFPLLIFLSTKWNVRFICQLYSKEHVAGIFLF